MRELRRDRLETGGNLYKFRDKDAIRDLLGATIDLFIDNCASSRFSPVSILDHVK